MIKTLEKSGRTEQEAIDAALAELGLERDDVNVEIVNRAKSGFLGIGAVKAVVRVSYEVADEPAPAPVKDVKPAKKAEKPSAPAASKQPAKAKDAPAKQTSDVKSAAVIPADMPENVKAECEAVRSFLSGLFERMNVKADMEFSVRENGAIDVNLTGNNLGAVIGRRGETLDAIQHLTNYVVSRGNDKRAHINIDAESYRAKREESLVRLAEKMAEKAIKYKRNMALEPMNSYERHVIHTALQNYEGVSTNSTGEEPNRRVVVVYQGKDEAAESTASTKPKSREWA